MKCFGKKSYVINQHELVLSFKYVKLDITSVYYLTTASHCLVISFKIAPNYLGISLTKASHYLGEYIT